MQKAFVVVGFAAVALTIIGQIVSPWNILLTNLLWLVANLLFLVKAIAQQADTAEKVRNVCMLAVTVGVLVSILV